MKKINLLTLTKIVCFTVLATVFLQACSKDGEPGLDGKDGIQGEQGIPGMDGTSLLSGEGIPKGTLGKNGDFYLDKASVELYGPKTDAGWGNGTALKGEDGQNGKDGATILGGTVIPTAALGTLGDFYFDTQNLLIYGPKVAAGWGSPVSLQVPSGLEVTVLLYKNQSFQKITPSEYEGKFDLESIIPIDKQYQAVYDNGIILTQIRKSNDANSYWDAEGNYLLDDDAHGKSIWAHIRSAYDAFLTKEKVTIMGTSYGCTEEEIKAAKMDIKVVFIPATKVIEMQNQHINTKDSKALAQHLKL